MRREIIFLLFKNFKNYFFYGFHVKIYDILFLGSHNLIIEYHNLTTKYHNFFQKEKSFGYLKFQVKKHCYKY